MRLPRCQKLSEVLNQRTTTDYTDIILETSIWMLDQAAPGRYRLHYDPRHETQGRHSADHHAIAC